MFYTFKLLPAQYEVQDSNDLGQIPTRQETGATFPAQKNLSNTIEQICYNDYFMVCECHSSDISGNCHPP